MTQLEFPRSLAENNKAVQPDKPAGLPCPSSSASFWHSEPNQFLLGHRTTENLPRQADVVIVGSGITGASAARFLCEDAHKKKNMKVVMLDAREVCWGATGRNGGHCQPLLYASSPEIANFEIKNVACVQSYIEENNIQCEWRSVTGCRTFWDEKSWNDAKDAVNRLFETNPEMKDLLEVTNKAEDFKKHLVKPSAVGMTLTKGAGQLWPYKYVTFIIEKLVKEGKLNMQTNTPVTKIGKDDSYHILDTPRGQLRAKHVILATNGYSSYLRSEFSSLIVPTRCEMSALHPPSSSRIPNSYGMQGYATNKVEHDDYLIQRPFTNGKGGHLMFGGGRSYATYNCVGEWEDDIVDPGEADYLRKALPYILELGTDEELKASHQWTGIKGYSRDNMPWIGRLDDGVWICAGYTGHGMPNATLCAKAVVEMLLGEKYEEVSQRLIENGELPRSYLVTKERIEAALKLPSVFEQDAAVY